MIKAGDIGRLVASCYGNCIDRNVADNVEIKHFLTDRCCSNPKLVPLIQRLRSLTKHTKEYDEQKRFIPCSTLSCVCNQYRSGDRVINRNPVICIDIDNDDNPKINDENVRNFLINALFSEPHVYAVGTSCSGFGIFAIVVLSSNNDTEDFEGAFRALEADFAASHITIDKHCKDVTRLRIASSDPVLIKDDDVMLEEYSKRLERPAVAPVRVSNAPAGLDDENLLIEVIEMLIENGYRADSYQSWLADGFALHVLGDRGLALYDRISQQSEGYKGYDDVVMKWRQTMNSNYDFETCKARYYKRASSLIGPQFKWTAARRLNNKINNSN